jgi:hypothetical protein
VITTDARSKQNARKTMPRESPCQAIFYVREKTPVSNIPEWLEDHVSPTPELLLHTLDRYHLPSKNRTGIFDRNPVNTVTTRGGRRNCWHVAVEKRQAVAVTPNRRTLSAPNRFANAVEQECPRREKSTWLPIGNELFWLVPLHDQNTLSPGEHLNATGGAKSLDYLLARLEIKA